MTERQSGRFISMDGAAYHRQSDGSLVPVPDRSDWSRVDQLTDAQLTANALSDPDALPMSDEDWRTAKPVKWTSN